MKTLKIAGLTLALFTLSASNTVTAAWDEKTLPGSSCKAYYGHQQKSMRTSGGSRAYVIGSRTSRAKQWVVCPLVEDTMAGGSRHNHIAEIDLYHPSNRTTSCYLRTSNRYGNGRAYLKRVTGSGYKRVIWNLGSSYSTQNSSIYCSVDNGPYVTASYGATRILSTRTNEQ